MLHNADPVETSGLKITTLLELYIMAFPVMLGETIQRAH